MTLNLIGSQPSSGIGFGQNDQPNLMANTSKAVLWVFYPHTNQFRDVSLRPYQYSFDENFLSQAEQSIDLSRRGTASAHSVLRDMQGRMNLSDFMTAAFQSPLEFKASHLSDYYRFILVFTGKAQGLLNGNVLANTLSNNDVRRIYTGFFQDEPFNPATLTSHSQSLNERAMMVITHKTVLGMSTEHGALGSRVRFDTRSSEDIIHPIISNSLTAFQGNGSVTDLHLMTPENCMNAIETDNNGHSIAVPGLMSSMKRDTNVNMIPDIFDQPAHNVGVVVKGMIKFQDEATMRSHLPMYKGENQFDSLFTDETERREQLGRHMGVPRSKTLTEFDLDVNKQMSAQDLSNLVNGDLDVIPVNQPRPLMYETADQRDSSVTNQYSFLIASVISPILNAAGLNSLEFDFQIASIRGEVTPSWNIHAAEPNMVISTEDTFSKIRAVQHELTYGIFKTLFESMGAFHVIVRAFTTGLTTIRLNLVDQKSSLNTEDFEIPSCLGGLVSPIIGDDVTNASNSERIESLYHVATGTQHISKSFNENDRNFEQYASERTLAWNEDNVFVANSHEFEYD